MDESISSTMEKTELSSANSFAVDERLWLRSFMYIRKKSSKERVDIYHLKNSQSISFKGVPEIPIDWIL